MYAGIIEKVLTLKANLSADKEQKIIEAVQKIEQEYAEHEVKFDNILKECGYVAPVEEIAEENETETFENQVSEVNNAPTI